MKYVYIVTRIMRSVSPGITDIPNLGVHTSLKKAMSHFRSVVEDRTGSKRKFAADESPCGCLDYAAGRYCVLASYYSPEHREDIRLEKWRMK